MHKPVRAGRFAVLDHDSLKGLIREVVAHQYAGHLNAAVKATNARGRRRGVTLNQSSLWRLMNGETKSVAASTMKWLQILVPASDRGRLLAVLTPPQVQAVLRVNNGWVTKQLRAVRPRLQDDLSTAREFNRILRAMRAQAPAAFNAFMDGTGNVHSPERVRLAFWRAAKRFLDHDASAGIERSWRELNGMEMRRYAEAALRCEQILLRRMPDVQRAQQAVGEEMAASDMRRWLADERPWTSEPDDKSR
jgi:hypothetical protein